ncbi:hypothetical protein P3X46_009325 [Hevea brasiliensis]|uniref:Small EDRK-rich factor-like N-terminal domain-containing protein n=1 Tax=Hevea brasiliensis TaxID=3981 RepID=A0ABQ9MP62_HEVBR|nr:11 kDa late embryogenesis abundant protein-like [Hevea brasiliensis]KAJ9181168.1 hypothetical protein P3X46_009325 [Hevea brasiliensis]
MQSMKENAANVAASAKAGIDKTKAVKKMSAHDPMQMEMATQKKKQRKAEAELSKQEAHEHNVAAKQAAKAGGNVNNTTVLMALNLLPIPTLLRLGHLFEQY